ncbi:hypothetical protein [Desulfoferrobacter suflitae]|uniref:hypothetical protein n=1 Tax=Desulfoferrobacter suflitae TaxID=2865782 RepID=UPI0021643B13|nr:hypothetical protein [Desulfoferrobacter suflitae]MCK8600101.1 hypothetical protein [Desulfoferrobacter suflitae]
MADARKYPRYPAKSGVLAVLHLPHPMVMTTGQVVDLGEGGIGFVYTGTEGPYTGPAGLEV